MMRSLRTLFVAGLLATSLPAWAGGIAIVDFQLAINEVEEGEKARQEIDALLRQKQQAIQNMEQQLQTKMQEYEKQRLILSDEARQAKEQEIVQLQQQYQQAAMQAEMEMQQLYTQKMEGLISKMRTISSQIGQEKGYDLVLEVTESGVVYSAATLPNITPELIKRYNGN